MILCTETSRKFTKHILGKCLTSEIRIKVITKSVLHGWYIKGNISHLGNGVFE